MSFIADFHIHSKYSLATSKDMDVPTLAKWARIKGISMLGTGDFTHPQWLEELKDRLEEAGPGVYRHDGILFLLTAEVANIYFKSGRTRKIHNILFSPSIDVAEEVSDALSKFGSLSSNGRPILGIACDAMARMLFDINPDIIIIPSHAWTPHFGIFGSNSGFDSIEECFEEQAAKIFSIETGLSSDPAMNRRWSGLDRFSLVSNSDAHSPSKIGREANVFKDRINYKDLQDILKTRDKARFLYTIEFYPEEGKYHWDGHRACGIRLSPREAIKTDNMCPVCSKKVTIGVMHRVEDLADRAAGSAADPRTDYKRIIPLAEIIGDVLNIGPESATVKKEYLRIIKNFGNEFGVLLDASEPQLKERCPAKIARGIINMRNGNVDIIPGYDGEYGKISVKKDQSADEGRQLSFL